MGGRKALYVTESGPEPGSEAKQAATKAARIRDCMRMMATGRWVPGISTHELMRKYGVCERAISGDAAEASRRIREGILLDDDLRVSVLATMADIARSAERVARAANKTNQPRTAIEALRTKLEAVKAMAGVAGVEAPKKVQVGGNLGDIIALAFDGATGEAPQG